LCLRSAQSHCASIVADSAEATGLKWAAPAGGGKVLQVVYGTTATGVSNSTNIEEDTGLTATITPSSATSKVLVLVSQNGCAKGTGTGNSSLGVYLYRGATKIGEVLGTAYTNTNVINNVGGISLSILDTPATTSATTYKTRFRNDGASAASVDVQQNSSRSTITLLEIGA